MARKITEAIGIWTAAKRAKIRADHAAGRAESSRGRSLALVATRSWGPWKRKEMWHFCSTALAFCSLAVVPWGVCTLDTTGAGTPQTTA